jgi:hypothetical protein
MSEFLVKFRAEKLEGWTVAKEIIAKEGADWAGDYFRSHSANADPSSGFWYGFLNALVGAPYHTDKGILER